MGNFFFRSRNCDENRYEIVPYKENILEVQIRELSITINQIFSRLDKLEERTSVTFKANAAPPSNDSTPSLTPIKHQNHNAFFMRGGCH